MYVCAHPALEPTLKQVKVHCGRHGSCCANKHIIIHIVSMVTILVLLLLLMLASVLVLVFGSFCFMLWKPWISWKMFGTAEAFHDSKIWNSLENVGRANIFHALRTVQIARNSDVCRCAAWRLAYMAGRGAVVTITHIHTCIHTCIHTYIRAYIDIHRHTYRHTYLHTYIHAYICTLYVLMNEKTDK